MGPERVFLGKKFALLCFCWSVYMYCYLITETFLNYTFGDDFTDIITVSNAEAFGYLLSGFLYVKLNEGKKLIVFSFLAAGLMTALMLAVH
jgi:hypothetical protein